MKDIEILNQLLTGNHLEPKELNKAKHIIMGLEIALKQRVI